MRLPIDDTTITLTVAGAAESVLDFSIEEPMGVELQQSGRCRPSGIHVHRACPEAVK